jgi:hypothetical protein
MQMVSTAPLFVVPSSQHFVLLLEEFWDKGAAALDTPPLL